MKNENLKEENDLLIKSNVRFKDENEIHIKEKEQMTNIQVNSLHQINELNDKIEELQKKK